MSYQASMRVWRGDDEGGALQDYSVEVNEGEVVLDLGSGAGGDVLISSDPGFGDDPAAGAVPAPGERAEPDPRIDVVQDEVSRLRGELSSLAEALLPVVNTQAEAAARREGTLGIVHDQTWAIRKDLSDFYEAWDSRAVPPPPPRLDRVGTRRLAAELARRLNPFKRRQFWARAR